jgi:AcrR family transcriptional regulator
MGRKAYFSNEQFIKAALKLIAEDGLGAVTVATLAKSINAPIGSVYHRFSSRELIMAELWLSCAENFQNGFLEILHKHDPIQAALYTLRWVRENRLESRVLLLYRREEFMGSQWPDQVKERAIILLKSLNEGILDFTQITFGHISPENIEKVVFALIDTPLAAAKRYLEKKEVPPVFMDDLVKKCCESILGRGAL